ncbi:MAG: energy-coupled thiamine transporter ThiT, partial [Oscillospiraceae bacterium]
LIALGFVLSFIKVPILPSASISLASMLPIIILAYKYGTNWGLLCGFVHGLLQMVEGGIDTPPTEDFWSYLLVILLDYILAFSFLGLAGLVRNVTKNPSVAISVCCAVGITSRFICSFLSGAIIWGVYAPEGQSPWSYSLVVNGTKFGIEGIFTIIVAAILFAIPVMQKNTRPVLETK